VLDCCVLLWFRFSSECCVWFWVCHLGVILFVRYYVVWDVCCFGSRVLCGVLCGGFCCACVGCTGLFGAYISLFGGVLLVGGVGSVVCG